MGGVVKGFQIDCNQAGQLGDLTGRGDQSSGKVVHKDRTGPLGDLTGRGDQPSGKVVLLSLQNRDNQHRITTGGRTGLFSSWATGIVRIHTTL